MCNVMTSISLQCNGLWHHGLMTVVFDMSSLRVTLNPRGVQRVNILNALCT
jgi:hypothetical protein